MTAFWHAKWLQQVSIRQQAETKLSDLQDAQMRMKEQIEQYTDNMDSIWNMRQQEGLSAKQAYSTRLNELMMQNPNMSDSERMMNMNMMQQMQSNIDAYMSTFKTSLENAKKAALKPLQEMDKNFEKKIKRAEQDEQIARQREEDYKKKDEESNKRMYGNGSANA